MDAILKYLWLSLFEFLPNFPALLSIVLYVKYVNEGKRKVAITWGFSLALLSSLLIAALENIKLSVTTLAPEQAFTLAAVPSILITGCIFFFFIFILAKYFLNTRTTIKTDIIVGAISAVALSIIEITSEVSQGNSAAVPIARIISHTVAFLIAFPLTIICIRFAMNQKLWWKMLLQVILATLVMTLTIAAIDYLPFIKS